uniref:Uncharacterized protein n=1 Tax=Setaria italica TaxID=4555 RepID=A0A0Q3SBD7_SETIT
PSMALRVLHITNCTELLPPPPSEVFPLLTDLKLLGRTTSVTDLQGITDAAPQLAGLYLERTRLIGGLEYDEETEDGGQIMIERYGSAAQRSPLSCKSANTQLLEASTNTDQPKLCSKPHRVLLGQITNARYGAWTQLAGHSPGGTRGGGRRRRAEELLPHWTEEGYGGRGEHRSRTELPSAGEASALGGVGGRERRENAAVLALGHRSGGAAAGERSEPATLPGPPPPPSSSALLPWKPSA